MGIGNRLAFTAPPSCRYSHYPSWGLETMTVPEPSMLTPNSLPLMGIGNSLCVDLETTSTSLITPHGDWKLGPPRLSCTSSRLSLPLMGIGNPRGVPERPALLHRLITPHGDWKLADLLDDVIGAFDSLPLMGIGNPAVPGRVSPRQPLITPHGDWKPSSRSVCWAPSTSHYPSWGLETPPP